MPKITAQFDEKKLLQKMKEYKRVTGKTVDQQLRNFSRVLGIELMKRSRPFYVKNQHKEAKTKTEGAIMDDLYQYLIVLNSYWQEQFKAAKSQQRSLYNKKGQAWLTDEYNMATTVAEVKAFYNRMRSKTTGRPPKRGDKNIGRHSPASYIVVPAKLMKKIRTEILKAVGKTRAGWAKAAQDCRADTKAQEKLTGIPAWVKRHMSKSTGSAKEMQQSFFGGGKSGLSRIILRSGVPYASQVLPYSEMAKTAGDVRNRMGKFFSTAVRAELRKVK